jgi:hypothetical protein
MEDNEEGSTTAPASGVSVTPGQQPATNFESSLIMNFATAAADQLLASSSAGLDLISDTLMNDAGGHLKRPHEDMVEEHVDEFDTNEL